MCGLLHLNRYVRYQSDTPAPTSLLHEHAKIFTKLNTLKGYHQCPLDDESQLLIAFITPFGRFKFLRVPYSVSSSEHYNCRMNEAFSGLSGYRRIVNDIVIYDSDEKLHNLHVRQFQHCVERSITLNNSKWEYAKTGG